MATYVLVPGFWLGGWAWDAVSSAMGDHDVHAVSLDASPDATLEDHTQDILRVLSGLSDVILVGHSGGGMPVSQAADRMPDRISRVVYVDSGPLPDGVSQADTAPETLPPGDGPIPPSPLVTSVLSSVGLPADRCHPQPRRTATDPVRRTGGRPVPQALITCSFPLDQVRSMIDDGHPYFALLKGADVYALPTSHWPMFTEPKALASLLSSLTE